MLQYGKQSGREGSPRRAGNIDPVIDNRIDSDIERLLRGEKVRIAPTRPHEQKRVPNFAGLVENPHLAAWEKIYEAERAVAPAQHRPALVRAVLQGTPPVVNVEPIHLDGVLAFAVVIEATEGRSVPDIPGAYRIPLPLTCLHRSEDGLPLWAASTFWSGPEAERDNLTVCKRMPTGQWSKAEGKASRLSLDGARGRFMERKIPLPTTVAGEWRAVVWGDLVEIARLLRYVPQLGKKGTIGCGMVRDWVIEPLRDIDGMEPVDLLVRNGCLTRAISVDAAAALGLSLAEAPRRLGWTPPQWKPSLHRDGWPVGTRVRLPEAAPEADGKDGGESIDYFAAIDDLNRLIGGSA